jgi:8-oxo-dGTP pyrophosphatase MutT (NUDIX family)
MVAMFTGGNQQMVEMPWHVVSRRCVVEDEWIQLYADTCVTPAGDRIEPYYVLEGPDAVHVVALTSDDRMVLVRQYRHAAKGSVLELPGGSVDTRDTGPTSAARRELLEETGFVADELRHVFTLHVDPARNASRFHAYVALGAVEAAAPQLDPGESSLTVHLMPIAAVVNGLALGLIAPAPHVAAILLGLAAVGKMPQRIEVDHTRG